MVAANNLGLVCREIFDERNKGFIGRYSASMRGGGGSEEDEQSVGNLQLLRRAEVLLEEAHSISIALHGQESIYTMRAKGNLGMVLLRLALYDIDSKAYEQAAASFAAESSVGGDEKLAGMSKEIEREEVGEEEEEEAADRLSRGVECVNVALSFFASPSLSSSLGAETGIEEDGDGDRARMRGWVREYSLAADSVSEDALVSRRRRAAAAARKAARGGGSGASKAPIFRKGFVEP